MMLSLSSDLWSLVLAFFLLGAPFFLVCRVLWRLGHKR